MEVQHIYASRFSEADRKAKEQIWKVLCEHFFQRYIREDWTVVDLAAGYCEYINNIRCRRKIAVDLNPETAQYAGQGVEVVQAASDDLSSIAADTIDAVFVSNFFEHLPNSEALLATLHEIQRVLRSGGKLMILQPNIRFLNGQYWDFVDHSLALTDRTLVEALELVRLTPVEVRPKFLPYTTKSRFPRVDILIRLYVRYPILWQLFGKQAWIVAEK
jgi:SAM-dependent methyltransferase